MAQTRYFDYVESLSSNALSFILKNFIVPGTYSGFDLDVTQNGKLSLSPGILLMSDGTVVEETEIQYFARTPPAQARTFYVMARHYQANIAGGTPVEMLLIEEVVAGPGGDLALAGAGASSFMQLSTIRHPGGSVAFTSAMISNQQKVHTSLLDAGTENNPTQIEAFPVPFSDGMLVTSGLLSTPLKAANQTHYYFNVTADLSFQQFVPVGMVPVRIDIFCRRPAAAVSVITLTVYDSAGIAVAPTPIELRPTNLTDFANIGVDLTALAPVFISLRPYTINLNMVDTDIAGIIVEYARGSLYWGDRHRKSEYELSVG